MPEIMTRKLFESLRQIGKTFGETGRFDSALLRKVIAIAVGGQDGKD